MANTYMSTVILTDVKKYLGLTSDYTVFDDQILMCINSIVINLYQMGVCSISNITSSTTWNTLVDDVEYNNIKMYVSLKTKMLFDPPTSSVLKETIENSINEIEWRLRIESD